MDYFKEQIEKAQKQFKALPIETQRNLRSFVEAVSEESKRRQEGREARIEMR